MSTGPDFVVKGAIYFVGFGAEDTGEVVRHGDRKLEDAEMDWKWVQESWRVARNEALEIARIVWGAVIVYARFR